MPANVVQSQPVTAVSMIRPAWRKTYGFERRSRPAGRADAGVATPPNGVGGGMAEEAGPRWIALAGANTGLRDPWPSVTVSMLRPPCWRSPSRHWCPASPVSRFPPSAERCCSTLSGDPVQVVQIMMTCNIANQAAMTWSTRRNIDWPGLLVYLTGGRLV